MAFLRRQFTDIPTPVRVRAEVTTDNTSIRVLWEWSGQGLLMCLASVRVDYQPEGGSLVMYIHIGQCNSNQCHIVQPPVQHTVQHQCLC